MGDDVLEAAAGARLAPCAPPSPGGEGRCGGWCRLGQASPSCSHTVSEAATAVGRGARAAQVPGDGRPTSSVTLGRAPRALRLPLWGLLVLMCVGVCGAAAGGDLFDSGQMELERHPHVGIRHRRSVNNMTVCPSIDIRKSFDNVEELEDCDVIEGHLKMVLIGDAAVPVRFPRLKQVTHYVIFYRVQSVQSFSEMFPNLAVIRGHQLFSDYALVVYENQQLRDLGLIGLTRIMRGTVRIEKNPYLCYLDTIDWERLTGRKGMVIQDNADAQECTSLGRVCMNSCANSTGVGRTCWNQQHCQTLQFKNCHPFCEGGCTHTGVRPSPRDCVTCKDVVLNGECMENCPKDTFLYEGWRCISMEECIKMTDGTKRFKAHMGQCVLDCPAGFTAKLDKDDREVGVCEQCKGLCQKWCQGDTMLNSIRDVEQMKGCTHINGSLRIQVSGENIVKELEENLKDITVISGYLRVSYSEPLVSMNFLRNLQVIGGRTLESRQYSLYFLQNVNLQSLWPNTTNLTVKRGRAFFHFNHQLCLDKIHSLLAQLNISTEDNVDVGPMTNGDQIACQRLNISASVKKTYSTSVLLEWDNFRRNVTDFRSLLGYNVYFREAPHRNLSMFTGRDACGSDPWKVIDFPNTEMGPTPTKDKNGTLVQGEHAPVQEMLTKLLPFTQYAFYVETMMALTSPNTTTGRSDIVYFTTTESRPSVPRNLVLEQVKVVTLGSGGGGPRLESLLVSWDPPQLPNGIITEYEVVASHNDAKETMLPDNNFCSSGLSSEPRPVVTTPKPTTTTTPKPQCCACPAEGAPPETGGPTIDQRKTTDQIYFENLLQNSIFVRRSSKRKAGTSTVPTGRRRRSIDGEPLANNITIGNTSVHQDGEGRTNATNVTGPCVDRQGAWCKKYQIRLPANETKNSTVLHELRHFAEYTVKVRACQNPNSSGERLCSHYTIASKKTRSNPAADALQRPPTISNHTVGGHVTLNWMDPPDPNGGSVLSYVIYTQRMDDERVKDPTMIRKCDLIKCKSPPCERKHEVQLSPGNNSLRVQAVTAAGHGPFSEPVFWVVEAPHGALSANTIVGIVLGLLCVLILCSVAVIVVYKRVAKQSIDNIYTSWNPYYGGQISYQPDDWEVDIEKVHFDHVIGKGSFGSVYEGTALLRMSRDGPDDTEHMCRVAIKTLLEDASMYDRQAFLSEASLMKGFNCYHVVRLMGIVSNMNTKSSDSIPRPPFVIMELMSRGDLKSYLRSMRPEDDGVSVPEHCPVLPHIYQMAIQIADGMAYLTQMNSVHRDLAARNCMVTEDMTIKIGDFGMTRHLYEKNYYKKGGKGLLPVRWMGPESLRDGRFTSQSDVWSFGVVLWEMCTYAAQPYQGLTNEEVIHHVLTRNRMARPANCPERLYELMYRCWEYRPDDRPTFIKLVQELLNYDIGDEFAKHSFYHTQWPQMVAEAEAREEAEPTVLTPLTHGLSDAPVGLGRRPRIAEAEDLSDEECEMEVRARPAARQPRPLADPEAANYAEFEEMRRNGGHGSLSSAENSKAHSLQFSSSDGSKGSKASNGSARNGYIAGGGLSHVQRTAEC
ncbi:insulin receptor-like isoform X1 [Amphibalanus amphitrite]|uniref:insulin receptor-like isoform X1 n=2 Tax=Amphibalanus amphitrite TaxID=1232801 RepID=UPI001C915C51|nr:insulin receptor-like isoform X1 [Amphibalanus amphitrite]